jgi:phage protein D
MVLDQTDESDISFLNSLAKDYGAFVKLSLGRLLFFRRGISISESGKELPTTKFSATQISDWKLRVSDMEKFGKVIAKWHNFATGKEEDVFAGTGDPAYTMRYKFVSADRALEAAKAKLAEFKRGAENLTFSTQGNPNLSAENKITFTDLKYLKGKNWIITSVNHSLNDQGFVTNVTAIIKLSDVE